MKKFIAVVLALIVSLALSFAPGANFKAESMTPEEMVQADLNLVVYDLLSVDVLNQTQTYSDLDITTFSIQNTHQTSGSVGQVWILSIIITYVPINWTAHQIIEADIDDINIPYVITGNIELPAKGKHGSNIAWSSSNPDVLDGCGNVTQGNEDISVTLTGTFSYQGVIITVEYYVIVKGIESWNDYYASIDDDLVGIALLLALRELITETQTHITSYEELKTFLQDTDEDPNNPDNIILFYCGISIDSDWSNTWNREHVWPQSLGWFSESGAGADLHHLRPTDPSVNSSRGNKRFGEVEHGYEVKISITNGGGGSGCYANTEFFEPRDEVKGDVARIIFYLFTRYPQSDAYDFEDVAESLELLLEWHTIDPVDEFESHRNDVIAEYQGNRNPYIDNPEYAYLIWS